MDTTRELLKQLEAVSADARLREFRNLAQRGGMVESYLATWHGRGILPERLSIRVDRYPDHGEIVAQVFQQNERGDWQPTQTQGKSLARPEWAQVSEWLEAGFWGQPPRDTASPVLDGDCWQVDGFRENTCHYVYRHTGSLVDGSGAAVYQLGKRLASLAGLHRFEDADER